jgi:hypothetical protein
VKGEITTIASLSLENWRMWNSLEIAKLIAALATPVVVAFVGFWINTKLEAQKRGFTKAQEDQKQQFTETQAAEERRFAEAQKEQDRQFDESQKAEERRFEEAQRKLYRDDQPRIELTLDCTFHGVQSDYRLAVFTVSAKNVGRVRHQVDRIKLRARAIDDEPFSYREEKAKYLEFGVQPREDPPPRNRRQPRVKFPHKVVETDLVPAEWNFIFVEPGVTQSLSYAKPISVKFRYLLAHVIFEYAPVDGKLRDPHSAETVFALPQELSG